MKFVYFDLGKVLLHFDHGIACRQMAQVAGVAVETVRAVVFESGLEDRYERGEISTQAFYIEFCERTGTQAPLDALLHAASSMFEPNQSSIDLVHELHRRGQPLGILSNTCEAHWQYVTHTWHFLRDCFPHTTLSFEVGCMKPDPDIYTAAARNANSAPGDVFFVDDRSENVAAARDAGFDAVLYQSADQLHRDLQKRGLL